MHRRLRSVKSGPLSSKGAPLFPSVAALARFSEQYGVAGRPIGRGVEDSPRTSVSIRLAGPAVDLFEGNPASQSESDGA